MHLIALVLGIVAFGSLLAALSLLVEVQQMSDEERKDLGLGPKGQGRR